MHTSIILKNKDYIGSPLHKAVLANDMKLFDHLLVEAGVKQLNLKDEFLLTPLHVAVAIGNIDFVKFLLTQPGLNIDAIDENGFSPLHVAAVLGHKDIAELLIQQGSSLTVKNKGNTALHYAVQYKREGLVDFLLTKIRKVKDKNDKGFSPFILAVLNNDKNLSLKLLKHGADPNAKTTRDESAILLAAKNGYNDILKLLIEEYKVNVKVSDPVTNYCVVDTALLARQVFTAEMLIAANSKFSPELWKLQVEDDNGFTLLHAAAKQGHLSVVAKLLKNKAAIKGSDPFDDTPTPLHLAVEEGHLQVVDALIEAKANINAVDWDGYTPLHRAAARGHVELISKLLKLGTEINAQTKDHLTPLDLAKKNGHEVAEITLASALSQITRSTKLEKSLELKTPVQKDLSENSFTKAIKKNDKDLTKCLDKKAEALVLPITKVSETSSVTILPVVKTMHEEKKLTISDQKLDFNFRDADNNSILHLAVLSGDLEKAKSIYDRARKHFLKNTKGFIAFIESINKAGATAFLEAVRNGQGSIVNWMLNDTKVNPRAKLNGENALHIAARLGYLSILKITVKITQNFLFKSRLLFERNEQGELPLHVGMRAKKPLIVELLYGANEDIYSKEDNGLTTLHIAAQTGNFTVLKNVVSKLVKNKKSVDEVDSGGWTPLHYAAANGHLDLCEILIKEDADINASNDLDYTPLHLAAWQGHAEIILMLFNTNHLIIEATDHNGATALHLAAEAGHVDAVKVLIALHANMHSMNNKGLMPVDVAVQNGKFAVAEILVAFDIYENRHKLNGKNILTALDCFKNLDFLEFLVKKDFAIFLDVIDNHENTLLHIAVNANHTNLLRTLLQKNVDINVVDSSLETALHIAVKKGNVQCVKILLENNINRDALNKDGKSALQLAQERGLDQILQLLQAGVPFVSPIIVAGSIGTRQVTPSPSQHPEPDVGLVSDCSMFSKAKISPSQLQPIKHSCIKNNGKSKSDAYFKVVRFQ